MAGVVADFGLALRVSSIFASADFLTGSDAGVGPCRPHPTITVSNNINDIRIVLPNGYL